jgi:hypothetical protein
MRAIFVSLAVVMTLSVVSAVTPARADADDAAWIKKCVSDNKKEGATAEVVAAWCSCMNNKMSSNETLSITAWEKTHPAEVAACDKEAGWKYTGQPGRRAGASRPSPPLPGQVRSRAAQARSTLSYLTAETRKIWPGLMSSHSSASAGASPIASNSASSKPWRMRRTAIAASFCGRATK